MLYTVEVTSSSSVEVLTAIEELLIGYLKLTDDADIPAEPVAVGGGVVTPVPEMITVVNEEGMVSYTLLSADDSGTDAVIEYTGGAMVVTVVAVIPPVSAGEEPCIQHCVSVGAVRRVVETVGTGPIVL